MKDLLSYKGFLGSVHFSAEDHIFFGKILGIKDLVTFEGETVAEIEAGFKAMVDGYIEDYAKEGKEPMKSHKGTLNVRLTPDLHQRAAYISKSRGISLNSLIKRALERELDKNLETT